MNATPFPKLARQILSALLCALYGLLAGGSAGAILTIYVYGIGSALTGPGGFVMGAILGWKTPLRDAILLMSGWIIGLYLGKWMCYALAVETQKQGVFIWLFAQVTCAGIGGAVLFFGARKWLSEELRFHCALSLSVFWILCALIYCYRWLYVWEP